MRIAFFADSYKPYLSGVTNSMELLVNELRELGHRVYVFAPRYPKHVDTDPDIVRFPSIPVGYPKFRLALPYVNRLPEVDLIHSHSPFQSGLLARYLARKRKVPFVYTFHTLFTRYVHYARFVPEPLSKLSMVTYIRQFCRGCQVLVSPSELARRVLRSWGIKERIEIVPSGVDLSLLPKDIKAVRQKLIKKHHLPANSKNLLYVGRISKEKNLPFILKAFKKIKTPAQLLLVGGGPHLKDFKKKKIKNVHFLGEVNYPEVLSYYALGDIFVFASLTETQGLVLVEAKAVGLPVVALFAGGLTTSVRSGIDGYLTPRNQKDFIEHIERLLTDEALRQHMGLAAKEDAHNNFSSSVVAKEMESIYNSVI